MPSYCIIYRGLHPGLSSESYARVLSVLLRLPARQLPLAVSPKGMVLANGLSLERAHRLKMELQRNGCLCEVEYDDDLAHTGFSIHTIAGPGACTILILLTLLTVLAAWAAFALV